VTLYEARGDFQVNVEGMRRAGLGVLYETFLRRREALSREGLLDAARKRPLPLLPRRVGVITSLAAAALQDVLAALKRRAPQIEVILYPAPVQGEGAGALLASAVDLAGARQECDCLILTRGGGSLEDLWAFNDEALARAIARSPIPLVCGVGHETDVTLADLVADLRAATPTAAAEAVSAGHLEFRRALDQRSALLSQAMRRHFERITQKIDQASSRLKHPREDIKVASIRLSGFQSRLARALPGLSALKRKELDWLCARLAQQKPSVSVCRSQLFQSTQRLRLAMTHTLSTAQQTLGSQSAQLSHLDPSAVLRRGYSIVRDAKGTILNSSQGLSKGHSLDIQFSVGRIEVEVVSEKTEPPVA
jgi:exodeoxyribonuclease VII large subunit